MEYEKKYYNQAYSYIENNPEYYILKSKISFFRYFSKIASLSGKKVLEYGCGLGQNIFLLKDKWGYDSSKYAIDFCKSKGIPTFSNVEKIPNSKFDIVLCSHTLEHVDNPLKELSIMKSKLKNDGILIIVLPKERHVPYKGVDRKNYHLYCWNLRSIGNLLDRAGFKVISTDEFRGAGFNKLSFISKWSFGIYEKITSFAGNYFDIGELVIQSKKIEKNQKEMINE